MDLEIRRLIAEDAEAVSKLIGRNFLEVNIKDYPKEEMARLAQSYNRAKILEMNDWAHFYVACYGCDIVGCGAIAEFEGKKDESILLTIFVLPERHGKGIGKQIMCALENDEYYLRAKRIEIAASITACDFYRKLGYDYKNGVRKTDDKGLYKLEKFKKPAASNKKTQPFAKDMIMRRMDAILGSVKHEGIGNWRRRA